MRIAFIGHSYHRTTRSSAFFLDLLRQKAQVEELWDDGWLTGAHLDLASIDEGNFDGLVVWQVEAAALRLARSRFPNVTFFPMFDSCHARPDAFWRALGAIKVVSFSSALHERLQRLAVRSRFIRFFPDPEPLGRASDEPGLAGYLWQRQQDVTWSTIKPLLGDAAFGLFTLHKALDPSCGEFITPPDDDVRRYAIRMTEWFATGREALADLARHNVYFAPRPREGIGMSFLEAMAMGFLVVGADSPTMNEYIVSGVNGLLYDPSRPRPLDFSRHAELGARARRTAEVGWHKWCRCTAALLEFVLTPTAEHAVWAPLDVFDPASAGSDAGGTAFSASVTRLRVRRRRPTRHSAPLEGGRRLRPGARRDGSAAPLVTVAVMTRQSAGLLPGTLESIFRQDWPEVEVIVLDRASEDGTLEMLREGDGAIDYWRSAPDDGEYDAINAAAQLASGRYVMFIRAGDVLHSRDALSLALDEAPDDADVITGHHVQRHVAGRDELRQSGDFGRTWALLRRGEVDWSWLSRVPAQQATLIRAEILRRNPYRSDLRVAADLELLCRLAARGGRFHHSMAVLATTGTGWCKDQRCRFEESRLIALAYSGRPNDLSRSFERMRRELHESELDCLPTWRLIVQMAREPRAYVLVAARLRNARIRRRAARGRCWPSSS